MKIKISFIVTLFSLIALSSCEKEEFANGLSPDNGKTSSTEDPPAVLPDGYFEVRFSPGYSDGTRAAVTGPDGRVRHLRYIIYDQSGNYVKDKVVVQTTDATPTWPLNAIKDTLPKGSYTAVFLANVDKALFPYTAPGGTTAYQEVLSNYKGNISNARISLPNAPFTDTSEYYWSKVSFSDTNTTPYVLLQRIIGMLNLHRNFVDAQAALNQLVNNIVTQMNYKNILQTNVGAILPGLIRNKLTGIIVVGLDGVVNNVASLLLVPVTNALYDILLQQLVNQIGLALTGNANQQGALAGLGVLLNSWADSRATDALVTINNFPKTMDFSLTVKDFYTGNNVFRCQLTQTGVQNEKDVLIKGFNGLFDIRKIDIIKQGLISGFLVDQVVDGSLLLNGDIDDINDPLQATVGSNFRYKDDYSFLDIGLKSYAEQTDGAHNLTLSVQLGNIANIDNILNVPILSAVIGLILAPIKTITVSTSINLPLLGVNNLTLSGSWGPVTPY